MRDATCPLSTRGGGALFPSCRDSRLAARGGVRAAVEGDDAEGRALRENGVGRSLESNARHRTQLDAERVRGAVGGRRADHRHHQHAAVRRRRRGRQGPRAPNRTRALAGFGECAAAVPAPPNSNLRRRRRAQIQRNTDYQELFLPSPILKQVTVVDTPGTNAIIKEQTRLTKVDPTC